MAIIKKKIAFITSVRLSMPNESIISILIFAIYFAEITIETSTNNCYYIAVKPIRGKAK